MVNYYTVIYGYIFSDKKKCFKSLISSKMAAFLNGN